MTDRTALQDLRAEIEAGEFVDNPIWEPYPYYAQAAFNGSLDAALALHSAVLPGWDWQLHANEALLDLGDPAKDRAYKFANAANSTPARAWLIAILKALIEEAGE